MDLTVKLERPVTGSDGTQFTELTLRDLTVDENIIVEGRGAGKTPLAHDKEFFAMSCGVPAEIIGKLHTRDWTRLKNRYWGTLGNVELELTTAE